MKKLITALLLFMASASMWAYDVYVDGIYYNLNYTDKTAEVTCGVTGSNSYSGTVFIPETILFKGVTYTVTSIGKDAFYKCTNLTSVTIGNSVKSIGEYAFWSCRGLTSVTIPNSVTSIGESAFVDCSGLTSVTISNSVTSIGSGAFSGCSGLTSVTIPNSVTSIGRSAFSDCSGLTSVTIPNSVKSIGNYAFDKCTKIKDPIIVNDMFVFIPTSYKGVYSIPINITQIIGGAFVGCTGLTSVTIGNSVTSIEESAFSSCSGLTSVTIPNSVTSIGGYAFSECSGLKTVNIGTGIKSIDDRAFRNCKNIETVTCYAEAVPSMGTDVFKDSYVGYATLKVPDASVNLYASADQWKDFGTITSIEGTQTYKLTYKVDGAVYKEYDVNEGATITPEAEPTKVGYKFSGWSTIPETMPANDVEVTGTFTQETVAIKVSENVEIKVGDKEATDEQKKAVAEILNNSTVTGMTISEMGLDKAIKADENYVYNITLSLASANIEEGNAVNEMVFDVKPMKTKKADATTSEIPNSDISGDITFRLPVQKSSTLANAKISHEGKEMGLVPVKTAENGDKYIEVTTNSFSKFGYVLTNETTGINSIAEDSADSPIYNISGQCAKATDKGILIKNGKKYIQR